MTTTRRGFFGMVFGGAVAALTPWRSASKPTAPLGRTWFMDATDYGPQRIYWTTPYEPGELSEGFAWGDEEPLAHFKIDKLEDK